MEEITSLPNSLREQIASAQNLLAKSQQAEQSGNTELALIRAEQGMKIIANIACASPELAAVLLGAQIGHSGIQIEETHHEDSYEVIEQKFWGIHIGTFVYPTHKTIRTFRNVKLI
ncbi:MAG: hypothetical protein JST12_07150 [Armatimonadetes bacterium]|nr:hypothetical protein [Armatimonadota bacterium]